jgi:hypothetical protein
MKRQLRCDAVASVTAILFSSVADAQWVFLGKKAIGAVSRLTTKTPDSPGYDVASVLIEARPEKVYDSALKILKEKHNLNITYIDDKTRSVEFTDDKRVVGMKAIPLGETVTHLLISSSGSSHGPGSKHVGSGGRRVHGVQGNGSGLCPVRGVEDTFVIVVATS